MTKAVSTINNRIKVINKGLRKAKKDWNRYEELRCKILKEAPRYGNIYDYSTEMDHEDQQKHDDADAKTHLAVKMEIKLKEEKDYLNGLLKGRMTKFDKYDWEYDN